MSKKKDINRMNTEKDFAKIFSEIGKQDFKSEDELKDFLNDMMNKKIDDIPKGKTKKDKSQDLVYQSYDLPVSKGKKLIKQALELDPDNVDAYNYLAEIEEDIKKALKIYEKGVAIGEKTLGKKMFIEKKGYFWGIFETRPYMRAKSGLAYCLYALGEFNDAIKHYQELLELNPNDNQGIRHLLSTILIELNDYKKYEELLKQFENEGSAVWSFNYALYKYKKEGSSKTSEKALSEAYKRNNNVIDYMLGLKKMPKEQPQYIGFGDENEAVACVNDTWHLWDKTKGAFDWLNEFKQKRLKMN